MINKILLGFNLIKSLGLKPVVYRAWHVFKVKSGLIKKSFPESYHFQFHDSLHTWKSQKNNFFFTADTLGKFDLSTEEKNKLKDKVKNLKEGKFYYFSGELIDIGKSYDWISNPVTKYQYHPNQHWSEIETLDPKKGDIKYVWEKSRFCYLYDLIRYDYHFKEDQSEFVFSEILSWIDSNPVNRGPNFSCSQELSIRMLNWTFALYYYQNSVHLTEARFKIIIESIYNQTRHVDKHINFSLISVRNNHAITEALLLYTIGTLYTFFPESNKWKLKGKKYLEQEGLYQIYEDGSYLQFSFNYQRVVIQLYTWAFFLARANGEKFSNQLESRVKKSLEFLYQLQDDKTGQLPNYGANDGALFFPLNATEFRDYRGQLNVLHYFFYEKNLYEKGVWDEDLFWFSGKDISEAAPSALQRVSSSFDIGGYYTLRTKENYCFIRCGSHQDRPSQADNLHLDIWVKGNNILRDAGSYRYNASPEDIKFFMGTSSHNTVMIQDADQMLKGGRFLWFYWTESIESSIEEFDEYQLFKGKIKAFKHLNKNIIHERRVKQFKNKFEWEVEDLISGGEFQMKQIWNIHPAFLENLSFHSTDIKERKIEEKQLATQYSPSYGVKENGIQKVFETNQNYIKTLISFKE